jgi:glycosyltransferase involved in cell wall biosynthesis
MNTRWRIFFVRNNNVSFIRTDLSLLSEHFSVMDWFVPAGRIRPLRMVREVLRSDLVFGWFASWHTFWPVLVARLLGRPSVVVVGGYDTANMSKIGYGNMARWSRRLFSRWTMELADLLIVHSEFIRGEVVRNVGVQAKKIVVLYLGVPDVQDAGAVQKDQKLILTVGNVDVFNLQRKGIEPFVRTAALLPHLSFVVVGAWLDEAIGYLRSIAPSNVTFTGFVSAEELQTFYARAAVYVQASLHEGFGLSVAEAMMYGCVPVVTTRTALPEVVGDTGVMIESTSPEEIAAGIRRAHSETATKSPGARARVRQTFRIGNRREGLRAMVEGALQARRRQSAVSSDPHVSITEK